MRAASLFLFGLACWSTGCSSAAEPSALTSGIAGIVLRSPIQPVCQVHTPCEAPFSADFTVKKGQLVVATFRSDGEGRFDVDLAPGTYLIVPSENAPIIVPQSQAKQVVVGEDKSTNVRLEFDTGIR
jgi:hypothetical protein